MVCTAARSEICDQRERGVHERRRSPKRTSLLRPTDARAARSVTARAAGSARCADPFRGPACLPAVRPSLRHLFTLHDASRGRGGAGSIVGALEAQGLHPPEQINLCRLHGRSAERSAGHCDQVARRARVPRGRDHRSAGAASPTADAAKRRSAAAAMRPQNSFLCAGRAICSFSPRAATKQL